MSDDAQWHRSSCCARPGITRDQRTHFHDLAAHFARVLPTNVPSSENRGRGATQGRARGHPEREAGKTGCALHPRSRVQRQRTRAHTSIQVQRKQSGLPCAMVLTVSFVLSAVIGFLATVAARIFPRKLDASIEASGPHDFAVRFTRRSSKALQRPPHPVSRP